MRRTSAPAVSVILALRPPSLQTARPPIRISGPLVSSMTGTSSPPAAARRLVRRRWNSSTVACEKLTRITLIPATRQRPSGSACSLAGPMVATILVSRGVDESARAKERDALANNMCLSATRVWKYLGTLFFAEAFKCEVCGGEHRRPNSDGQHQCTCLKQWLAVGNAFMACVARLVSFLAVRFGSTVRCERIVGSAGLSSKEEIGNASSLYFSHGTVARALRTGSS